MTLFSVTLALFSLKGQHGMLSLGEKKDRLFTRIPIITQWIDSRIIILPILWLMGILVNTISLSMVGDLLVHRTCCWMSRARACRNRAQWSPSNQLHIVSLGSLGWIKGRQTAVRDLLAAPSLSLSLWRSGYSNLNVFFKTYAGGWGSVTVWLSCVAVCPKPWMLLYCLIYCSKACILRQYTITISNLAD